MSNYSTESKRIMSDAVANLRNTVQIKTVQEAIGLQAPKRTTIYLIRGQVNIIIINNYSIAYD